jgi:hypothetical protein
VRLVVVDASAVGGGPVTRAVECAAAEARRCGVEVDTIRLYSIFSSCCASCGDCRPTSRCARRHRSLEEASDLLAAAQVLLVGVSSSASQRDPRAEALLRRLVGSFAGVYDSRHGEGDPDVGAVRKRAGLVSSASPMLSIAALLGALPYGLAGVWRVLDRGGVDVVGTASVARRWSGPAAWDLTRERAVRLGRLLAMRPDGRPALRPLPDGGRILPPSARPQVA